VASLSKYRYAARADAATQKIVDELRALGFHVEHIRHPVDLAIHNPKWGRNTWKFLEVKSRKKASGEVALRKDQQKQAEFCQQFGVPYVTDTFEALLALGERVNL
jgi:DNA-binding transcriptional MerR regulator